MLSLKKRIPYVAGLALAAPMKSVAFDNYRLEEL